MKRRRYLNMVRYFKVKDDYDYGALCRVIEMDVGEERKEVGRIFYLSISPSLYSSVTQSISQVNIL